MPSPNSVFKYAVRRMKEVKTQIRNATMPPVKHATTAQELAAIKIYNKAVENLNTVLTAHKTSAVCLQYTSSTLTLQRAGMKTVANYQRSEREKIAFYRLQEEAIQKVDAEILALEKRYFTSEGGSLAKAVAEALSRIEAIAKSVTASA